MRSNHHGRFISAVSLAVLGFFSPAVAQSPIIPLRANVAFSSQSLEHLWSAAVKSTDGTNAYVLSLEPDFDVTHHLVTLELKLRHAGHKAGAPNLLDPTGKRHGLQPYDFAAKDLAQGVQKSAFGEKRTISLKNLRLQVHVAILGATVSPISRGNYQIDALELQIVVDNSIP